MSITSIIVQNYILPNCKFSINAGMFTLWTDTGQWILSKQEVETFDYLWMKETSKKKVMS